MQLSRWITIVFAAVMTAAPARAQQWGGPLFSSPLNQDPFELVVSDANGAGTSLVMAVRPFARNADLRLRLGILDGLGTGPFNGRSSGDTRAVTGYVAGLDYARPLNPDAGGPVRATLVTGVGLGVNVTQLLSVPLGVSVAYDGGRVRPYVTPRVVLEHHGNVPSHEEGWRTGAVVDWGVDVDLPLGGTLRAALTTGSYTGGGIGISF